MRCGAVRRVGFVAPLALAVGSWCVGNVWEREGFGVRNEEFGEAGLTRITP